MDCSAPEYSQFKFFGALMVAVWPVGVPMLFASLLHKHRWELLEPDEVRQTNFIIDPIRILFEGYRPAYFFWELVATLRRLFLIGFLVVIAQGSVTQLALGLFVSLTTITLHCRVWPQKGTFDNVFSLAAEWLVYLALFLGV